MLIIYIVYSLYIPYRNVSKVSGRSIKSCIRRQLVCNLCGLDELILHFVGHVVKKDGYYFGRVLY